MYINLNRVEFVITYHCSSNCKHCTVADASSTMKGHIQYDRIKGVLTKLSQQFNLESVMCFGGEPMLYYHEVSGIMKEASDCGIPKRQVITNGYFHKDKIVISEAIQEVAEANVNDILLSVDSFHQEYAPLDIVYDFARQVVEKNIRIRVHPAWVINRDHENEWNRKTKESLRQFEPLGVQISNGNDISPSGNAIKYLSEFYEKKPVNLNFRCGQAEYTDKLDEVKTISIMPNGDVCICCFKIGNVYEEDIMTILQRYDPYNNPVMDILMKNGVQGLLDYAKQKDIPCDEAEYYSACGACRDIVKQITERSKNNH